MLYSKCMGLEENSLKLYPGSGGDTRKAGWWLEISRIPLQEAPWTVPWSRLLQHHRLSTLDVFEGKSMRFPRPRTSIRGAARWPVCRGAGRFSLSGRTVGRCRSLCGVRSHLQRVCCQLRFLFTRQFGFERALKQPRCPRTQPGGSAWDRPGEERQESLWLPWSHTLFFSCRVRFQSASCYTSFLRGLGLFLLK